MSELTAEQIYPVVQGANEFAVDLYQRLAAENEENLFLSPWSISSALSMAMLGAKGETESQMRGTMHFDGVAELYEVLGGVQDDLNAAGGELFALAIANRLWGREGLAFLESYTAALRNHFGAELARLDFGNDPAGASETINSWVSENTANKIEQIVTPDLFSGDTGLVLTNAIYFKGNWKDKFKEEKTEDADFHLASGETIKVPMMHQKDKFGYGEGENYQLLSMPYAGDRLAMVVVLPNEDSTIDIIEEFFDKQLIADAGRLVNRDVKVWFPKFKVESEFSLAEQLAAMGMEAAFHGADFSGITTDEEIEISDVIHKAFVEVNEEGTEAAAATAVVMTRAAAAMPSAPPEFRADRPFLFLIRDQSTGAVLFVGRVMDPR